MAYTVTDSNGNTVVGRSLITSFRGEVTEFIEVLVGPVPGKSAKVLTKAGVFYASVFGLNVVDDVTKLGPDAACEVFSFGRWYQGKVLKVNRSTIKARYTTGSGCTRDKNFPLGKVRGIG